MNNIKTKEKLEKKEILKMFRSAYKDVSEHKIGIEYERLPIFSVTSRAVDYQSEFGICNFLRNFAREENWDYIMDDYNIIGLKQGHDTITLEPGCQVEFSVEPKKTIDELKNKIEDLDSKMKPILNKFGIQLLNYGVSPLSTHKSISLIPKKRYKIMAKYLWGILSDVMMRETAGIQCCIDFKDEEDAMRKFRIANKLTPFMTAMFANSPIRGGVETGYKSFRALSWLNTDNDRCGFVGQIDDNCSFEDYVDYVLDSPMIFINRDSDAIALNGKISFNQFMEYGYEGYSPDIEDFQLHANLYFPEVRLRNFVEIRNHDCVSKSLYLSILAIYKGIFYDEISMDEIEELFKDYTYRDFSELRYNVPKNALSSRISGHSVKDIVKEILYIAEKSLIGMGTGEEKYLDKIKEYSMNGICPADIIIRNWNGLWNKDIKKLIKFVSEQ